MNDYVAKLVRMLSPAMKDAGFQKKGQSWFRTTPETITVLNLQMSRWDGSYFVNLGVLTRQLDPQLAPHVSACQVRHRIENLMPDRIKAISLFDFSNKKYRTDEGYNDAVAAICTYALPLLKRCGTLDGLRAAILARPQLGLGTSAAGLDFLGISREDLIKIADKKSPSAAKT